MNFLHFPFLFSKQIKFEGKKDVLYPVKTFLWTGNNVLYPLNTIVWSGNNVSWIGKEFLWAVYIIMWTRNVVL